MSCSAWWLLAFYWLFAHGGRSESSHPTDWLTVLRHLKIVASAGRESIQFGVVILAIAAITALRRLGKIDAVYSVLYSGVAGSTASRPPNHCTGITNRLCDWTVADGI